MSQPGYCARRWPSAAAASSRAGGVGDDVDDRIGVDEARGGIDREDRLHRGDRGAGELDLQFVAAPAREGVEIGRVAAAPGEERDLVDGGVEAASRPAAAGPMWRAAAAAKAAKRVTKAGVQMSMSSGQP